MADRHYQVQRSTCGWGGDGLDYLVLGDVDVEDAQADSMHQPCERPRQVVCVLPRNQRDAATGAADLPWYTRVSGLHLIFSKSTSVLHTGGRPPPPLPPAETAVPTLIDARRVVVHAMKEYGDDAAGVSCVLGAARRWLASTAKARLAEMRRTIAARAIQRAWRTCVADPGYAACRRRLAWEFSVGGLAA